MRKLSHAAILILAPVVALPQQLTPAEKFRADEKYANTLSVFSEPQLASDPNGETYRMFIVPTFYHPIAVRIDKTGRGYTLVAKRLGGQGGYGWGTLKDVRRRRLTTKEWRTFLDLMNRISFWTQPTEDKEFQPDAKGEVTICLDSTTWTLEGTRDGTYHVVKRYCPPRAGVKELGLYMIKLTKWKTKESDFR